MVEVIEEVMVGEGGRRYEDRVTFALKCLYGNPESFNRKFC